MFSHGAQVWLMFETNETSSCKTEHTSFDVQYGCNYCLNTCLSAKQLHINSFHSEVVVSQSAWSIVLATKVRCITLNSDLMRAHVTHFLFVYTPHALTMSALALSVLAMSASAYFVRKCVSGFTYERLYHIKIYKLTQLFYLT